MDIIQALAEFAEENHVSTDDVKRSVDDLGEWFFQFTKMRPHAVSVALAGTIVQKWTEANKRKLTAEESIALMEFIAGALDRLQHLLILFADPNRLMFGHEGEVLVSFPAREQ